MLGRAKPARPAFGLQMWTGGASRQRGEKEEAHTLYKSNARAIDGVAQPAPSARNVRASVAGALNLRDSVMARHMKEQSA
jgi:hypothetical protein